MRVAAADITCWWTAAGAPIDIGRGAVCDGPAAAGGCGCDVRARSNDPRSWFFALIKMTTCVRRRAGLALQGGEGRGGACAAVAVAIAYGELALAVVDNGN